MNELESSLDIRIGVVGVGGGGSNAVSRIYRGGIKSAKTFAVNTDRAHLYGIAEAHEKILLGKGLGAGGDPELARKIADSHIKELDKMLEDLSLLFIAAGMGGGTGTGVAPLIAELAKEKGIITVAMVTFPFALERARIKTAQKGINELIDKADTVVVIDNNRLLHYAPNLPINDAFKLADSIITRAVTGISDTIMFPSLLNIDFADLRSLMTNGNLSMIAVGEGSGVEKIDNAVESTINHPLLDVDFEGAKGALIHLEGSRDLTLGDAIKAGEKVTEMFDPNADVKLGARINPVMDENSLNLMAVVVGVKSPSILNKSSSIESENIDVPKDDDTTGLDFI